LPFTRGYVYFDPRNHATVKYGFGPDVVFHWDNIGFDGPVIAAGGEDDVDGVAFAAREEAASATYGRGGADYAQVCPNLGLSRSAGWRCLLGPAQRLGHDATHRSLSTSVGPVWRLSPSCLSPDFTGRIQRG
jgi:hypothetical protein